MKVVSSAYAWALAIIPRLVTYNAYRFGFKKFIITVIEMGLNILFLLLITENLTRQELIPGTEYGWACSLYPYILFTRGNKIAKQYGYGII